MSKSDLAVRFWVSMLKSDPVVSLWVCGGQGEWVAVAMAMGRVWLWRRIILMMKGYGDMNDVRK